MLRFVPWFSLGLSLALGAAFVQRAPPERASLTVRLLDAEGHAWTGPGARSLADSWSSEATREWPAAPQIAVYACAESADATPVVGERFRGTTVGPGEGRFEVAEGARCLVIVLGPGFDGRARLVEVPAGGGPVVVEVRAQELGALATLTVHVTAEGREIWGGWGNPLGLELESTDAAAPLLSLHATDRQAPFVFRAPAGRYRALAAGQPSLDWHGRPRASRSLGRAEGEVELVAGEARELTLALGEVARLELTLGGQPDEADARAARAWQPLFATLSASELERERARRSALAEVQLLRPGRRRDPVVRPVDAYAGTSAAGEHLLDEWPLGATNASEPLPSGSFTLLGRLPGGREVRVPVELVAGATTRLALRF